MNRLVFIIILILCPIIIFSDVLDKLKEIDDALTQGTIVYYDEGTMKNQNNEPIKMKISVIFSKTGLYKIKFPRNIQVYFDWYGNRIFNNKIRAIKQKLLINQK